MSRKELLPIPEMTESRRSYDHNAYRNYNLRHQARLDPRTRPVASPIGDIIVGSGSNPRHWMYLFENLQCSIMRIFHLAQNDRSPNECKEVIFLLEKYLRSFHSLYENFHLKHRSENVAPISRNKILQPVIPDLNELYEHRYRSRKELVGGRTERRARKHEDDIEINYGDDEYSKQKHAMILHSRKQEENLLAHRNHEYSEKHIQREKLRRREHSEETNSTGEEYEQFDEPQPQEMANDINEEQQRREHHERVRKEHVRCERSQSPNSSKMYEKLFGDSRQSKDVQREIEKFNKTMHQQPRNDELLDEDGTEFSEHYKQHRVKHTVHSKKQILDNIAGHSDNVFKYLEDEQEEDKDLEKYNELKEDETLTDISEIGQNDDPFSENMTSSHHKKSVERQSHNHRSSSPRKVSIKNPEVTGCEHLTKRDDQWEMPKPKLSNSSKKKETYQMPNDDFITTDYLEPTCI